MSKPTSPRVPKMALQIGRDLAARLGDAIERAQAAGCPDSVPEFLDSDDQADCLRDLPPEERSIEIRRLLLSDEPISRPTRLLIAECIGGSGRPPKDIGGGRALFAVATYYLNGFDELTGRTREKAIRVLCEKWQCSREQFRREQSALLEGKYGAKSARD